ncbi:MAG: sulfotransferase family 2 domain-containing protein [Nodosilinea sp.]
MLISYSHKFIFIHVCKNAGTSIKAALLPYTNNRYQALARKILRRTAGISIFNHQLLDGHATAEEIIHKIGKREFEKYFSFGIVRNPWDWQVSLYNYTQKFDQHPHHKLIKELGSFDNYIHYRCGGRGKLQRDFLFSQEGEKLVDFVGKYENLSEDFGLICKSIKVSVDLPYLNVSKEKPYQEYYNSKTRELVCKTFSEDIEAFGYSFD